MNISRLGVVWLALFLSVSASHAQGASFHAIPGLGVRPEDVSADGGVIVGSYVGANGIEAFRWTEATGIVGIGDLPGGDFVSEALGVSADGNVVVGYGTNAVDDPEPFRWTSAGLSGLGGFPDTDPDGEARGSSADGSVVVGFNDQSLAQDEAFRWSGAMMGLGFLTDGFDSGADDVSADGTVIVGWAEDEAGNELPVRWSGAGIVALGDLPGGDLEGEAWAVSADGNVAVGHSSSAAGDQAFRWTQAGGMIALGFLPGGLNSIAHGVSGDGGVIVGESFVTGGARAFIWTADDGMRDLKEVLQNEHGLDLTAWTLTRAFAVSDDGTTIVGIGAGPGGASAWRAVLPRLALVAPAPGALVVGGDWLRVRWVAPEAVAFVDLVLLPDTLGALAITLRGGALASDGGFAWNVTDTLFTRSARLVLRDVTDPTVADTSGYFQIKPYRLTRLTADGARYDRFRPDRHGWPYANDQPTLFPPAWFGLPPFNYAFGPDPFTGSEYDDDFPAPPINGGVGVFADWPAFVRVFGTDNAYHLIVPFVEAFYRDSFTAAWGAFHGGRPWRGSCSGMAVSSLLAFGHREAFGARYPVVGPVQHLFGVGMSDGVREVVNTLYAYWPGQAQRTRSQAAEALTPRQTLAELKAMLLGESRAGDAYLYLRNLTGPGPAGAHAVVPYRLQRVSTVPDQWRVFVYDPNLIANAATFVLLDSTANTWSYAPQQWAGPSAMYLMNPATDYLTEATVPATLTPAERLRVPADARGGPLYVGAAPGADVTLAAPGGGAIGYAAGATFNTIDGGWLDVPPVGGPTPPVGYAVPAGPYALTMSAFPDSAASAYFFAPGAVYAYGRADADAAHTDRLRYDPAAGLGGGLTARSDDAGVLKHVTLRAIVPHGPDAERTLEAAELPLTGPDSVRFAALDDPAGPRLRVSNRGGAKTYTLRLRQADSAGEARFRHVAIPLAAGATHVVRPMWATLGSGPVEVDVDLDGDGTPDEVLVLENQPVAAEPGVPPSEPPAAFVLHGPAPNPAAGSVTIRYDVPSAGAVRLAIYDAIGREVAALVNGERPAGAHEVVLDAGLLARGTYVVRLTSGHETHAQRLTITR